MEIVKTGIFGQNNEGSNFWVWGDPVHQAQNF